MGESHETMVHDLPEAAKEIETSTHDNLGLNPPHSSVSTDCFSPFQGCGAGHGISLFDEAASGQLEHPSTGSVSYRNAWTLKGRS